MESTNEAPAPSDPPLASLKDLPHELLLQIVNELDDAALCALGNTCKDLNNLIFSLFFDKHRITDPLQGWISCYRAPEHTLRAIRCSLSTKNIRNIRYYFNRGIEKLVEEVEDIHAIVRRTDEVTDFGVYLADPDDWALRDAPRLDEAQAISTDPFTIHGVKKLPANIPQDLEGKLEDFRTAPFVEDQKNRSRLRISKWFEFFSKKNNGSTQVEATISSTMSRNSKASSPDSDTGQAQDLTNPSSHWANAPVTPTRKIGPPAPKLESLLLHSDMLLATPSFLDWTNQLLSWCAPTLTHLELQCPETLSGIWCKFFSEVKLPSLTRFEITSGLVVGHTHIQGSDVLGFLSRHPSIQKLSLYGIQMPTCFYDLPKAGTPILPNLIEIKVHPIYIRWFLRDKKQCPKLKQVILQTEYYASMNPMSAYDALDRALEELLPHSRKLNVIGFRLTKDNYELNSWLRSHVDAGPTAMIGGGIVSN
ncbi:hypothetical protein H1R20_g15888, partial [Candolleomyces eurysporus]